MPYFTTISIPVVFHADDDNEARQILETLLEHFARDLTLGDLRDAHGAEVSDAPTADGLDEVLPYEPIRHVPTIKDNETHELIGPAGRSADCQWSRHILCFAPVECQCRCHSA